MQAIGPREDLTIVKRRKLKCYGNVSRSSGLAKIILQSTLKRGRRQGRQRNRWEEDKGRHRNRWEEDKADTGIGGKKTRQTQESVGKTQESVGRRQGRHRNRWEDDKADKGIGGKTTRQTQE